MNDAILIKRIKEAQKIPTLECNEKGELLHLDLDFGCIWNDPDIDENEDLLQNNAVLALIWRLRYLPSLSVTSYPYSMLPDDVRRLTNVERLRLISCPRLSCLPNTFGLLANLKSLHIHNCNNLNVDFECIKMLRNLKTLQISVFPTGHENPVTLAWIGQLQSLTELKIEGYPFKKLPQEMSPLKNLNRLEISQCPNLEDLSSLAVSENLEVLCLFSATRFPRLPLDLTQLKTLQLDNFGGARDTSIPPEIGRLVELESLCIQSHTLEFLPQEIGELANLQELSLLACSRLRELPETIGNMHNLRRLDLRDNNLNTMIPTTIKDLPALKILELSGNRFENNLAGLFETPWGEDCRLENLRMQDCGIDDEHLTRFITNLPRSLIRLDLSKNDLVDLGPFLRFGLPPGIKSLRLDLHTDELNYEECIEKLPEVYKHLEFIGDATRCCKVTPKAAYSLCWNAGGRKVESDGGFSAFNVSLWPLVFARLQWTAKKVVQKGMWKRSFQRKSFIDCLEASLCFNLLQASPDLVPSPDLVRVRQNGSNGEGAGQPKRRNKRKAQGLS